MDAVTSPSNSEKLDVDGLVALYVELRDKIAELKSDLKVALKPYQKGMEDLDGVLLKHLQDTGAQSVKTVHGTVYQRVERSATIKDKKAFREFVLANEQYDLIDWRANKVAVFDFIKEQQAEVPGVNVSAFMTIGVLRGNAQEE